jgi:hypothetical protein
MTSTLALPAGLRRFAFAWWPPMLLPVLPFAVLFASEREFGVLDGIPAGFALLVFGGLLTLGLPALLARCTWSVRKEAEQLRPAWLVCLFVAQFPALAGADADEAPLAIVFAATCALIATFSFGAEFQQRTMSGLLSQPVDRRRLWATKMQVLGVALLLHWVAFTLAMAASGMRVEEYTNATVLGLAGAILAWATTPWWTLLTRTVLAGLVFSTPLPLVGLGLGIVLADALESWDAYGRGLLLSRITLIATVLVLGPGYAIFGFWATRRRWLRLEAPDQPGGEGGGIFVGAWRTARPDTRPGGWPRSLIGKELRLQTVTLASLMLLFGALLARWALPLGWTSREYLGGLAVLFGITTLLLAAATPIAEERRLGTLDGHVLLPVSRGAQWWVKLGLAFGLAAIPVGVLVLANRPASIDQDLVLQLALLTYAFAFCLLASSGTASALRALLLGLGLTAAAAGLVGASAAVAHTWLESATRGIEESALSNPDLWFARARSLAAPPVPEAAPWPLSVGFPTLGILAVAYALVPFALAVFLAGANFSRPAGAPQRLGRQIAVCFATILALLGVAGLAGAVINRQQHTALWLANAWHADQLQQRLSPAERTLKKHSLFGDPHSPYDSVAGVSLRVRALRPPGPAGSRPASQPATPSEPGPAQWVWDRAYFPLPLAATNRTRIIHDADLPESTRDALRREAANAGEPTSAPGSGRPPGPWPEVGASTGQGPAPFQMSPQLMRRYGLIPARGTEPVEAPPAPQDATTAVTPAAPTNATPPPPPPFRMSPELMRRYGLIPSPPAPPTPATDAAGPAPAPDPQVPASPATPTPPAP